MRASVGAWVPGCRGVVRAEGIGPGPGPSRVTAFTAGFVRPGMCRTTGGVGPGWWSGGVFRRETGRPRAGSAETSCRSAPPAASTCARPASIRARPSLRHTVWVAWAGRAGDGICVHLVVGPARPGPWDTSWGPRIDHVMPQVPSTCPRSTVPATPPIRSRPAGGGHSRQDAGHPGPPATGPGPRPDPVRSCDRRPQHPHIEQSSLKWGSPARCVGPRLMGWPTRWWVAHSESRCATHHLMGQPIKWPGRGQPPLEALTPRLRVLPSYFQGRTVHVKGYPCDRPLCARDPYGDDLGVRTWCTKSTPPWPGWVATETTQEPARP